MPTSVVVDRDGTGLRAWKVRILVTSSDILKPAVFTVIVGACLLVGFYIVTTVNETSMQSTRGAELADLAAKLAECGGAETEEGAHDCSHVVYAWSEVMPLSRTGIQNIRAAAEDLDVSLTLVDGETLWDWLKESGERATTSDYPSGAHTLTNGMELAEGTAEHMLVSEMIAAGATVHYPAILVYDARGFLGRAILGFKTKEAYRAMIAQRLARDVPDAAGGESGSAGRRRDSGTKEINTEVTSNLLPASLLVPSPQGTLRDIEVDGRPGSYFRYVPARSALAFESHRQNYLLELKDGVSYSAPGYVDLVPSPDGGYFVTPRRARGGLEFYDADDIFTHRRPSSAPQVSIPTPIYVDYDMRDQYPSVGILEQTDGATTYRVLTSWIDGIVHRDYEVRHAAGNGQATVRPLSEPVRTCPAYQLSTPIIAKDGREVAARDEATGTTKIFRVNDDVSCDEILDVGMQTGKVAWDSTGRRIAFAIPRGVIGDGSGIVGRKGEDVEELHGVFVLERESLTLTRVPGSEEADRITFPEFVGDTAVVFVIRGNKAADKRDRFRVFCCLE